MCDILRLLKQEYIRMTRLEEYAILEKYTFIYTSNYYYHYCNIIFSNKLVIISGIKFYYLSLFTKRHGYI